MQWWEPHQSFTNSLLLHTSAHAAEPTNMAGWIRVCSMSLGEVWENCLLHLGLWLFCILNLEAFSSFVSWMIVSCSFSWFFLSANYFFRSTRMSGWVPVCLARCSWMDDCLVLNLWLVCILNLEVFSCSWLRWSFVVNCSTWLTTIDVFSSSGLRWSFVINCKYMTGNDQSIVFTFVPFVRLVLTFVAYRVLTISCRSTHMAGWMNTHLSHGVGIDGGKLPISSPHQMNSILNLKMLSGFVCWLMVCCNDMTGKRSIDRLFFTSSPRFVLISGLWKEQQILPNMSNVF